MHPEEVDGLPTGMPGVYVLLAFSTSAPYYLPYYVGQSGDIQRRLGQHMRPVKPFLGGMRAHARTYFTAAHVSVGVLRTAAEAALIRLLEPVGNDVVPIALNVTVNPPPTGFFGE